VTYAERRALISNLEHIRNSRVLTYFLADRETTPPGIGVFSTQLSAEPQPLFYDHLRAMGKVPQLDLFLYTRGGITDSVWPFVNLLRGYCDNLTVIVPFRAHSAGTLICLGANEVIMTDLAELSPIDPTTGNQFNPSDPTNAQNKFGISVEDVTAYFKLAGERTETKTEGGRLEILKELTREVHPLALGNVERVYQQIRQLARRLLELHLGNDQAARIDSIVQAMTEKFYSHVHAIGRQEALGVMGDWVREPTPEETAAIWPLYEAYVSALKINEKFGVAEFVGEQTNRTVDICGALIETTGRSHAYVTKLKVYQRPNLPPNIQLQVPQGQNLTFPPWASRTYEFEPRAQEWKVNNDIY
jgi:hypothetical protein